MALINFYFESSSVNGSAAVKLRFPKNNIFYS